MDHVIIVIDGECGLCSKAALFISKRDKADLVRFATSDSDVGSSLMSDDGYQHESPESWLLKDKDGLWKKSDVLIRLGVHLKGVLSIFLVLKILPRPIRDPFYSLIAKNRYKIFGRQKACDLPDEDLRRRIIYR